MEGELKRFMILYAKKMPFLGADKSLTVSMLPDTHVFIKNIEVEELSDVFYQMQGEIWSPNGEAYELIKALGATHTSMSVGDIAYDVEADIYYQCDSFGWTEVPKG